MRWLAWAFAGRLCDKYHNLISWLILSFLNNFDVIHKSQSGFRLGHYTGTAQLPMTENW